MYENEQRWANEDAQQRVVIHLGQHGDPRFFKILGEMWELHVKKGQDYGDSGDFLANLRASEGFGIPAWVGALIRQNDKLIRLRNVARGVELANESAEDSLIDNACYAVLALVLFRETLREETAVEDIASEIQRRVDVHRYSVNSTTTGQRVD